MTLSEFSNEFDVLYNNIMSNQAPGLDEYEKSVFLTKAQDEIVKAYFDPRGNKFQEGFDGSEKRQIDFSMLIREATPTVTTTAGGNIDPRNSGVFKAAFPSDAMVILNEILTVTRNTSATYLQVVPLSYTEYTRLMSKPFKRPLKSQAWRLQATTQTTSEGVETTTRTVDLITAGGDTVASNAYKVRYIKKPKAIILSSLDGVTLDNVSTAQNCELDPLIHKEILQRAVELAKAAYTGDLNSQLSLGVNSATNMGIVPQSK